MRLNKKYTQFIANFIAGVSPEFAAKIVYQYWVQVRRIPRPKREMDCYITANRRIIQVDNKNVAVYYWGCGPQVLLIHGWGGRATQFFLMVEKLTTEGYSVLAFDAPGHGDSSGKQTNLRQFELIVTRLYQENGQFEAIIAHSFGFIAAVNALQNNVKSRSMIGIASPADYQLLVQSFTDNVGLNNKAKSAFIRYLKKRLGISDFDEISIHHLAKQQKLPCLIVHDENDQQVPISNAVKISKAWPSTMLYAVKGSGHLRILYHRKSIEKCITFLKMLNLC